MNDLLIHKYYIPLIYLLNHKVNELLLPGY